MLNNLIDTQAGFRFTVAINSINYAAFTEFRLPNLDVQTAEIQEGGQNTYIHKLPVRVSVGPATLRHGISRDLTLLNWYLQVLKGDLKNAYRQVTVVMYDVKRTPLVTWDFMKAIPVKWSGPTLKADDNSVAIEEIEFIHQGFEVS
jgi:phage tail-like protein